MKIREKTNLEICSENNLKVTLLSNVAEEVTTKNQIRATMQIIAKALCGTLGPYGSTSICQDAQMKHHLVTKDGYDLLNRMIFDNEISRTILDLLKNISSSQVASVGDGSTSAIVVASSLYEFITNKNNNEYFKRVASKDIVDILNYLGELLEIELKKIAKPMSEDMQELDIVAAVAVNNDKEAGQNVANIYKKIGKYGFISTDVVEIYKKDTVEYREGISWHRSYIEDYFTLNKQTKKINHIEPWLFLTTEFLGQKDLPILSEVIGNAAKNEKELIIVCNGADQDARTFFKKNRLKHLTNKTPELVFTVVDIDQVTETGRSTLENLAILTGCQIWDSTYNRAHTHPYLVANFQNFIGKAHSVAITPKETQVICDASLISDDYIEMKNEKVKWLEDQISIASNKLDKTMEEEQELFYLRSDYNTLLGNTAILHVGGQTLTERMSRERLLEDAILACKSAINNGTIYGGNLAIPKIIETKKEELIKLLVNKFKYLPFKNIDNFFDFFLETIKSAFLASYKHVLDNAYFTEEEVDDVANKCLRESLFYNLKTHEYESFDSTSVINSVDTDIQIMKACISIIGLLATSNQVVTSSYCMSDAIRKE